MSPYSAPDSTLKPNQAPVMGINGLRVLRFEERPDQRGSLTTVFPNGNEFPEVAQWNLVRSRANAMRGMHAHLHYDEFYLPLTQGTRFGFADLRKNSSTFGVTQTHCWSGDHHAIVVPRGVAHGVYHDHPYELMYALSTPFDGRGEFACRYDDPTLTLWEDLSNPLLSERDAKAGSYASLIGSFDTHWRCNN